MKKLNLVSIATSIALFAGVAQADTFDVIVKWHNQSDYQAAFDTPKQQLTRAKQMQKSVAAVKASKSIANPVQGVNALSGYTLEHIRSGANRTDRYQVEAERFEDVQQALMATGYFEYVSLNATYTVDPIAVDPSQIAMPKVQKMQAKAKGLAQAQSVETNAFNDPYFPQQVVFQPQGRYTMGAAGFLDAMNYVSANKQMTGKVRVAVLDQGKWQHEDMTWSEDEVDMLSGRTDANCATADATDSGNDVICAAADYIVGTRDNDATAKSWAFSFDGNGNPTTDGEIVVMSHGLLVSSVIAAKNNNGVGIVAANDDGDVELVPVRVLGRTGGKDSDIIDGIYWSAGMSVPDVEDISAPVDIINMSLGGIDSNGCSAALQEAIDYAYERGITVVVAAGNDSIDVKNFSTGSCDNILTVGAHTLSGEITSFSNFGEGVDVTMLGDAVYAARISNGIYKGTASNIEQACIRPDGTIGGADACYWPAAGTSIATPLAAAMIAQIKMVKPELSPDELMAIARNTAGSYDVNEIGQTTLRKSLFPNAGAGNAYKSVASTFSTEQIETGTVAHQFAYVMNDDQELYLDAMADTIGKDTVCNSYQANFGYFDKPVENVHYEIYQSNSQDATLTTSNSEYIPPVGGGVLEYPQTTVNMQSSTRLGVRACKSGNCGDIFELDLTSAQKPTYCL